MPSCGAERRNNPGVPSAGLLRFARNGRGSVERVYPRRLYQGCGTPGVFTLSVYTDVLAVRNSVRRSFPPNAQLAHTSGISMIPILLPSGPNTHTPPVPVQNPRPA